MISPNFRDDSIGELAVLYVISPEIRGCLPSRPFTRIKRAVGPFLSRAKQLSIDSLFHAQYEAIVSRAITRVWAEIREKSWGKQGPTGVDPARSRWF